MEKKIKLMPGTKVSIETTDEGSIVTLYEPEKKKLSKDLFNDGDILINKRGSIVILKGKIQEDIFDAYLCYIDDYLHYNVCCESIPLWRKATGEELSQFRSALKKRNLQWNSELKKVEPWEPAIGEQFYYIGAALIITEDIFDEDGCQRLKQVGNCYPTEEIAEAHKEKVTEAYK